MNYEETQDYSVFDATPAPLEYASTGQRFANFLIDMIIVYVLVFGFFYLLGMLMPDLGVYIYEHGDSVSFKLVDRLLTSLLFALFFTLIEGASKGRTVGKLITGTCAVNADDGRPITWKQALQRSFSRIVPFEPFSGFSGNPWHDKWSNTTVVRIR